MNRSPQTTSGSTNPGPDVSQLADESLSASPFPAPRASLFRVYFDPQAYGSMMAHAAEDTSVEICGVLVGDWSHDPDGPFVSVRNYVRCDDAAKKFAEVTFTHESWSHINKEMDTKYQDQRIVGWYHSHPNFGIFLSDRDLFIQQNFFSACGQIALVIDPVRKIEGVFEWHKGNAVPTTHFWVGDRVLLAPDGSDATGMPESPVNAISDVPETYSQFAGQFIGAVPSSTLLMLAAMSLFLMGWVLSGWRSAAERRAMIEGTVAHFGIWKGIRPGLEEALITDIRNLDRLASQVKLLSADHLQRINSAQEKDDKKSADRLREDWKSVLVLLDDVRQDQRHVVDLYAYTPEEREALRRYVEQKMIEISRQDAQTDPAPAPDEESQKSKSDKSNKGSDKSHSDKSKPKDAVPRKQ